MAGGVYHVWARGNRREAIFVDDVDRLEYLRRFGETGSELGWRPLAYALMSNHVHHLVELTEPNLSRGIKLIHGGYAAYFNERHRTGGGHLFEKRFGSSRARCEGTVMYFACYVLLNPVRAGLSSRPEGYRWSSAAIATRPSWVDHDRLIGYFGSVARFATVLDAVAFMGVAGFEPATHKV